MNNRSAKSTIKALQHCFTTHTYLQVIISDNGPVFTSEKFKKKLYGFFFYEWVSTASRPEQLQKGSLLFTTKFPTFFVKTNGMKHIRSAPYHPATNICAEIAVRTLKTIMKKLKDIEFMSAGLQMFLFQ